MIVNEPKTPDTFGQLVRHGYVVLPPVKPAALRIRTRCYTTYDSEGFAHDEWVDEILPADGTDQ